MPIDWKTQTQTHIGTGHEIAEKGWSSEVRPLRWGSRERKCEIETQIGVGHEITKREGGGVVENAKSGWRWVGVSVSVGQGLGWWQRAETKCED